MWGACVTVEVSCPQSHPFLFGHYDPFQSCEIEPKPLGLPWTCLFLDFWDVAPVWLSILQTCCCLLCSRYRYLKDGQVRKDVCTGDLRWGKRWQSWKVGWSGIVWVWGPSLRCQWWSWVGGRHAPLKDDWRTCSMKDMTRMKLYNVGLVGQGQEGPSS